MICSVEAVATKGITALHFPACAAPAGWMVQTIKVEVENNVKLDDFVAIYEHAELMYHVAGSEELFRIPLVQVPNGGLPVGDPLVALLMELEVPRMDQFEVVIAWLGGLQVSRPVKLRLFLGVEKAA